MQRLAEVKDHLNDVKDTEKQNPSPQISATVKREGNKRRVPARTVLVALPTQRPAEAAPPAPRLELPGDPAALPGSPGGSSRSLQPLTAPRLPLLPQTGALHARGRVPSTPPAPPGSYQARSGALPQPGRRLGAG